MGKNTKTKKKNKTESVCETFYLFFGYLLDLTICVYMLLILVILPFYNEEGFKHIGTDKSVFFRETAMKCGMILLPVLALFLICKLVLFLREPAEDSKATNTGQRGLTKRIKQLLSAVKDYCKNGLSCTDYFVLAYGVAVLLSYAFSNYKEEALWGTTGWYMGTIPQLMLVISYFVISKAWGRRNWLLLLVLPVSTVVFVLGYLNRFGFFPIDMQVDNTSFISTIGNINWYCGYLTSVFFGGVFLLWKKDWEKLWQKLLLMGYVLIGFATLVTHGSSSGVVAMAGLVLVFFCLSVSDGKRMEAFWLEMCLLSLACVVTYILRHYEILTITMEEDSVELLTGTVFSVMMTVVSFAGYAAVKFGNVKTRYPKRLFMVLARLICAGVVCVFAAYLLVLLLNTKSEGALLASTVLAENEMFMLSPMWGSQRGTTWAAGALCFWEQDFLHKLVGIGPDCMAAFLYNGGSNELLELVKQRYGSIRLTNAHNEWLTILVNVGVLGFVSYVGTMVSAIKRYISNREHSLVAGACGCCLLAYTINNMFSFQQSMSAATIFIVLAVGENYLRGSNRKV